MPSQPEVSKVRRAKKKVSQARGKTSGKRQVSPEVSPKAAKLAKDEARKRALHTLQEEQRNRLACSILAARGRITARLIPRMCSVLQHANSSTSDVEADMPGGPSQNPRSLRREGKEGRDWKKAAIDFTGQSRATTLRQHSSLIAALRAGEDVLLSKNPLKALHDAVEQGKTDAKPRKHPEGFQKSFLEDPEKTRELEELLKETALGRKNEDPAALAAALIPAHFEPWHDPGKNHLGAHIVLLSASKIRSPAGMPEWQPHYSEFALYECSAILYARHRDPEELNHFKELMRKGTAEALQDRKSALDLLREGKYLTACGQLMPVENLPPE